MALSQWLILAVFVATLIALIKYQQVPQRVFSGATLLCLGLSFVSSREILANAVNPGLVTMILLVLCSFAFERTSVLRRLAAVLFNGSKIKSTFRILLGTALASALMSNTAVVASMISTVKNNQLINPGKLLLPMSFAAILGGTLTLIGTSTNLIVNSMLIEQDGNSMAFFDFTLVGGTALIACLCVLMLRIRQLPDMDIRPTELQQYFVEAEIIATSNLVGKSVQENGLRDLDSLFLVEVVRNGRLITPVTPDEILHKHDKLIFSGDISKVLTLQQFDGVKLFAEQDGLLRNNFTEVLIKPDASIVGKSLKTAGFRARFDAAVVAIRREGGQLSGKLGEIVIQSGDFLVLAVGNDFSSRTNLSKNFFILSGHQADNMLHGWRDKLTILGFMTAILTSIFTELSLLKCLIFYFALLIISGCLEVNEIKRRFPLEIWSMVLGALTLAKALENSGVMSLLSISLVDSLQGVGVYSAFVAVFLITLLLTELITNNAAAALVFPLAYNMALALDVSIYPFVMAVAFGASGSFISPYGYQTNVMVFNAGNYTLSQFVKFGIPISLTYSLVILFMLPWLFPF